MPSVTTPSNPPLRLAVLLSGGGRTLQNFIDQIAAGALAAEIVQVISSHPEAHGLERARKHGLPHQAIDFRGYRGRAADFSAEITAAVDRSRPDLVAMAGFLRRWSFPPRYEGKVMNIHPALLPAFGGKGFYGDKVHEAVLRSGAKFSGCTVHFATEEYDQGPIILQRIVPVLTGDSPHSLAERIFREERIAYPEAINYFTQGRLEIRGGLVIIRPSANPALPQPKVKTE
ncbi:MAG: phosphoribosylglycinamide formyltransferase [Planctomycetes bacterium]|nr:phosphoribosylglycinamide formyltransferase [Planctomycetota bacterium]